MTIAKAQKEQKGKMFGGVLSNLATSLESTIVDDEP
jgi:hypothetical protein